VSTITEVVDGEVPRPRGSGPVVDVITALMVKDPARRMPLDEVRLRLRPLIDDPDDPTFPGSPDAPTMEAVAIVRPASVTVPGPRHSATGSARLASAARHAAPLAADPGPLPGRPSRPRTEQPVPTRPQAPGVAAGLAVAGAAVGASHRRLGCHPGDRWPVATTAQNVTTVSDLPSLTATPWASPSLSRSAKCQSATDRGRPAVGDPQRQWRRGVDGRRGRGSPTPKLPGTEILEAPTGEGGPPGTVTLSYRTDTRTSWRTIVPSGGTAWVITLTVPRGRGSASEELFQSLAGGFSTTA
jgi:hypothetical protein